MVQSLWGRINSAALSHAAGSSLTARTVQQMSEVHSRKGRAPVPPEYYRYWLESLLQAVKETDPEVTPQLLERWRQGMSVVVNTFVAQY